MKLKKWLSRALVLAMVVALMIPVPVAAKSSGGGKLVKSVTYYSPVKTGGWKAESKVSYKYGKKGMPTEITTTYYNAYFLGVPVSGSSNTTAIKYKGKSAKSYDSAGFLTGKRTYKKGKLASFSTDNKTTVKKVKNGTQVDFTTFSAYVGHASYFKNGLAKASDYAESYMDSDNKSYANTSNTVYAWTQKKGVPSAVVTTSVRNGTYDTDGDKYDGKASSEYAIFNSKGFAVEVGEIDEGKNVPEYAIQYTMKKGKVDSAVVYSVDSKGVPTPAAMMKFAYTKTSVSKTKYFNIINSMVDREYGEYIDYADEVETWWSSFEIPGGFSWY